MKTYFIIYGVLAYLIISFAPINFHPAPSPDPGGDPMGTMVKIKPIVNSSSTTIHQVY
jgi:hypothetical protein